MNHETMKFVLVMCCGQGQACGADDRSFWWADLPDEMINTIAAMIGVQPKAKIRIIKTGGSAATAEVAGAGGATSVPLAAGAATAAAGGAAPPVTTAA